MPLKTTINILIMSALLAVSVFAQEKIQTDPDESEASIIKERVRIKTGLIENKISRMKNLKKKINIDMDEVGEKIVSKEKLRSLEQEIKKVLENFEKAKALFGRENYVMANNMLDDISVRTVRITGTFSNIYRRVMAYKLHERKELRHVGKAVDRTDMALARAARAVNKSGEGRESFPGLRRAYEIQEKAKIKLYGKEPESALRLTLKARDLVVTTLKQALDKEDLEDFKKRAQTYWENTNKIIERIEAETSRNSNEKLNRAIEKAKSLQEKAAGLLRTGKPIMAERSAKAARTIVNSISSIHRKADNVENEIRRVNSKAELAEDIIEKSGNEKAAGVLEKGREQLENAEELAAEGKKGAAAARVSVAARLIAKSVDIAGGVKDDIKRDLRQQIRRTQKIVDRAAAFASSDYSMEKAGRAENLVDNARIAEQNNKPKKAMRFLDEATDLAFEVIAREAVKK
ncbi:MAG: hypothetical protein ACLFQK_04360 [Fibrobacterota bacterium]